MAKRAVVLHGTSADPESAWRPWLKAKLEEKGYEVWVPSLPENDTPNRQLYNDYLLDSDWDFTDNIVVGHSSGAVAVLNLLMDKRCPKVKLAVPVSIWASGLPKGFDDEEVFANLFPPEGFDFERIKANVDKMVFLQNDNDPYCRLEDAQYLSSSLNAELVTIHTEYGNNADHLSNPLTELPELWQIIEKELA